MKKILLPTNFSDKSDEVIAFALEAFNDKPCEFYFLHTYQYSVHGLDAFNLLHDSKEFFDEVDLKVHKRMVQQVNTFAIEAKYIQHTFKLLCKSSEFVCAIKEAIEKFDIDIILIGTKGMNSNTKNYKEKKVNDVVAAIHRCPVMAVPSTVDAWKSLGLNIDKLAS